MGRGRRKKSPVVKKQERTEEILVESIKKTPKDRGMTSKTGANRPKSYLNLKSVL